MRIVRLSTTLAIACTLLSPVLAEAQNGTIRGTLVEEGTLAPLASDSNHFYIVWVMPVGGTSPTASGSTDSSGLYTIANLAPGSYYVKATAANHVDEIHPNIACIAADCPMTVGTPVAVAGGATTTVDFALAKEGRISGTVRRASDGSPVGSVGVRVYNASTSFVTEAITASDGSYVVGGLATSSYIARAVAPQGSSTVDFIHELYGGVQCHRFAPPSDCRVASGTLIAVTAGSVTSGIDFSLDKGASIAGIVTADGTGTPLANVKVTAYIGTVAMGTTATNSSGQYAITGLPAGRYRVRTDTAPANYVDEWQNGACLTCPGTLTTLTLSAGETLTGLDFSLVPGGTITGTLSCTQGSTGTAPHVDVFDSTGHLIRSVAPPFFLSPGGSIGCNPPNPYTYTVSGLPSGQYFLLVRDTPFINTIKVLQSTITFIDQLYGGTVCVTADCDVRKGVPVAVTAGATTANVNFTLQRGGEFGLLATSLDTSLKLYDARGVEVVRAVGTTGGLIAIFPIAGLPPGTYYLTMDGLLNGGVSCVDCPPTAGRPIVVNPDLSISGEPDFSVVPARRISGTITNAAGGAPLSTISVELVSQSGTLKGRATTDMLGRYTIDKLSAGTYYARTVNDRGFVDEVYPDVTCGTCDPRSGTPIVVPSGTDVMGIDLALATGGVLTGVVTDTARIALGDLPVSIYGGSSTLVGVKTTSASGLYRLTLPAATYTAVAEETAGTGSEIYAELPCTSGACNPATGTPIPLTTGVITAGIDFTLASCSAMSLSPALLATGVVATTYRQVFSAVGGSGPYAFDVTDGTLPLGLTLNASTGVLNGTPTVAGRSTFRVSALDANGCATDRSYVLDVQACAFTLSPASATLAAAGGNVTITIGNGCGSQDVAEGVDWIAVQSSAPGQVTLAVSANAQNAARTTTVAIGRRAFEVRQAGVGSLAPYGELDLPTDGAQVSGAIAIGGWALDDVEVTRVRIYRDPVAGEPTTLLFVGTAVFIPGARPDVQQLSPGVPRNDRAGFGFLMLTNTLPNQGNGTFRIHAIAEDAEGHSTLLGSRTIVGNNAAAAVPFGTIDTPGQGETIAGSSFINFGWALTPRPAMIPTDGSTIQVIIDGASIGNPAYNFFRPDVSNTFPGLANSDGPVGYRVFDTTALTEGLHTISWMVTDSRPATAGLGSRYFIVANSADALPGSSITATETETAFDAGDVAKPLGAAPAPDLGRRAESLAVAANDEPTRGYRLTAAPMERIEVALDPLIGPIDEGCAVTWAGYLLKENVLSDLPVGASLDPTGTFYWQSGPGFAGRFPLRFVRTDCRGNKNQTSIVVTIANR